MNHGGQRVGMLWSCLQRDIPEHASLNPRKSARKASSASCPLPHLQRVPQRSVLDPGQHLLSILLTHAQPLLRPVVRHCTWHMEGAHNVSGWFVCETSGVRDARFRLHGGGSVHPYHAPPGSSQHPYQISHSMPFPFITPTRIGDKVQGREASLTARGHKHKHRLDGGVGLQGARRRGWR